MPAYKAPVRDIKFVREEVFNYSEHYQQLGQEDVNAELCDAILDEAGKFVEQVIAPLNRSGDEEGCTWSEQGVTTPAGFKEAYQQFMDGGWPSLSSPVEYGGQGLPASVDLMVGELLGQANQSWSMYPGLSGGARSTLVAHGTDQQKDVYLTKLVNGKWSGTMCLTEPQCGSDLSFLRTKAEANGDGSFDITGTKIFISSGEHDMAENIVHIVLARLPGAPAGTKGISLFLVPKFLPAADGSIGERNSVNCGSIEHKMGIHGNATCVMNFDGAKGFIIGEPHKGLYCMFTFMNTARIGTAIQGLSHAEVALQGAWNYACEREAGRAITGVKQPERSADLLIVHPDVRRMMLTTRAFAEGNRAFTYFMARYVDIVNLAEDEHERKNADLMLSFLTPIAKGFMTENGLESANLGIQIFGGHGYIREWGMEQNARDARISTLYEGTTGIQSMDLLARKVMGSKGVTLQFFIDEMNAQLAEIEDDEFKTQLAEKIQQWQQLTESIGVVVADDLNEIGSAASDYLMFSGYVVMAFFWAKMAAVAKAQLVDNDDVFYRSKVATARFYFAKILPRTLAHAASIAAGADSVMALSDEDILAYCQ